MTSLLCFIAAYTNRSKSAHLTIIDTMTRLSKGTGSCQKHSASDRLDLLLRRSFIIASILVIPFVYVYIQVGLYHSFCGLVQAFKAYVDIDDHAIEVGVGVGVFIGNLLGCSTALIVLAISAENASMLIFDFLLTIVCNAAAELVLWSLAIALRLVCKVLLAATA